LSDFLPSGLGVLTYLRVLLLPVLHQLVHAVTDHPPMGDGAIPGRHFGIGGGEKVGGGGSR